MLLKIYVNSLTTPSVPAEVYQPVNETYTSGI
jgi:hypothetical protein